MPTIGDLIAKWANGRNALLRGEIEELRLKMNRIEAAASRLDTLSAPTMGLDPNIFRNSGGFSVLPHPCAILYKSAAQSIPNATWTSPTTWLDFSDPAVRAFDMKVDTTAGYIYSRGIPGDTVIQFTASALFASNATGTRSIALTMSDGGGTGHSVPGVGFLAGVLNTVQVTHVRVIKADNAYNYLQVYQNSGGALDLQGLIFTATRLR